MIDKNMEPYYDAMLSIFIGVICILLLHRLYDIPRIIVVDQMENNKNVKTQHCDGINL